MLNTSINYAQKSRRTLFTSRRFSVMTGTLLVLFCSALPLLGSASESREVTDTFAADAAVFALAMHKSLKFLESGNEKAARRELCSWLNIELVALSEAMPETTGENWAQVIKVLKLINTQGSSCKLQPEASEVLLKYGR